MSAIGGARGFDLGLGLVGAGSTPFSNTGEEPLGVMVQNNNQLTQTEGETLFFFPLAKDEIR
jgi:hypothetical protein